MNHTRLPSLVNFKSFRSWVDLDLEGDGELRTLQDYFRTTDNATLYLRFRWWLLNHFYRPPLTSPGDNESTIYTDFVKNEAWWHDFNNREQILHGSGIDALCLHVKYN